VNEKVNDPTAQHRRVVQTSYAICDWLLGKRLYFLIMTEIDSLLVALIRRSTSFPSLNRIKVGMLLIPTPPL
jgi:hypothetical protein